MNAGFSSRMRGSWQVILGISKFLMLSGPPASTNRGAAVKIQDYVHGFAALEASRTRCISTPQSCIPDYSPSAAQSYRAAVHHWALAGGSPGGRWALGA